MAVANAFDCIAQVLLVCVDVESILFSVCILEYLVLFIMYICTWLMVFYIYKISIILCLCFGNLKVVNDGEQRECSNTPS